MQKIKKILLKIDKIKTFRSNDQGKTSRKLQNLI